MPHILAFTDTETTHLSADLGEVWEVGVVRRTSDQRTEHLWQIAPLRLDADVHGEALRVSRYAERFCVPHGWSAVRITIHPDGRRDREGLTRPHAIQQITAVLSGTVLAANNPSFDDRHLRKLLDIVDEDVWSYRPLCVVTRAEGYLWATDPQWMAEQTLTARGHLSSRAISERLGVKPPGDDAHEALPDARWMEDLYNAVPGPGVLA
jgi:hypothetical protein